MHVCLLFYFPYAFFRQSYFLYWKFNRYYSATILQMSGLGLENAIWWACAPNGVCLTFMLIAMCVFERVGRRLLTLISLTGEFTFSFMSFIAEKTIKNTWTQAIPIRKNRGAVHFAAYGLHVGNGVGCPWAAHGNFAMRIRLPSTSIYGNNGQLSSTLGILVKRTRWSHILPVQDDDDGKVSVTCVFP